MLILWFSLCLYAHSMILSLCLHSHSHSLARVVMMKSKEFKTSRSMLMLILWFSLCLYAHSLILSLCLHLHTHYHLHVLSWWDQRSSRPQDLFSCWFSDSLSFSLCVSLSVSMSLSFSPFFFSQLNRRFWVAVAQVGLERAHLALDQRNPKKLSRKCTLCGLADSGCAVM